MYHYQTLTSITKKKTIFRYKIMQNIFSISNTNKIICEEKSYSRFMISRFKHPFVMLSSPYGKHAYSVSLFPSKHFLFVMIG